MTPRPRKPDAKFVEVPGYPDLELNRETGVFYVRKSLPGRGELFKSTRCKTKRRAQTIAETLIAEATLRKPGLRAKRIRIAEICDYALAELEKQTRQVDADGIPLRSLETYRKDVYYLGKKAKRRGEGVIRKLFGDYLADEIDEQFWKRWVDKTGRGLGRTLSDVAKYLSLVLTWAFEEKYLGRKPRIRNPEKPKKTHVIYDEKLMRKFFQAAEPTLQDLIILGAENPFRPKEVREMTWEMVDLKRRATKLPPAFTKTREGREVPLSSNTIAMLKRRWKTRNPKSPFVFPAPQDPKRPVSTVLLSKMWKRMKKKLKERAELPLENPKFHWFRHTFYTKAILEHGLLAQASEAGGTSIKTLQKRYLKSNADKTRDVSHAVNLKWESEE